MIFSENTYRKIISTFLLAAYLLVSVLSLLHYHHIDLDRPDSISTSGNDTFSELGSFNGQYFICTIHQNYLQLHNTSNIEVVIHSPDLRYLNDIAIIKKENYYSHFNFYNISLRAPPISS